MVTRRRFWHQILSRKVGAPLTGSIPQKSALTRMEMTKGNVCSEISQVTGREAAQSHSSIESLEAQQTIAQLPDVMNRILKLIADRSPPRNADRYQVRFPL